MVFAPDGTIVVRFRTAAVTAGALLLALVVGAPTGLAVTTNSNERTTSLNICTEEDPPEAGIDSDDLEAEIEAIDNKWEGVPKVGSSTGAISITVLDDCSGPDVDVEVIYTDDINGCCAKYTGSQIQLSDNIDFCYASAEPCDLNSEYSARGILLHEMGHALGAFHSGGCYWNNAKAGCQSSSDPTMRHNPGSANDSYNLESLQSGDKAHVPWMETGGGVAWWGFDPGFEIGQLGPWKHNGDSADMSISVLAKSGTNSLRLDDGLDVWMDTVYDPWNTDHWASNPTASLAPGMTKTPDPEITTWYRELGNKDGGIRMRYRFRFVDYNTKAAKGAATPISWAISITPLATCNESNQTWEECEPVDITASVFLIQDGATNAVNNAAVFRTRYDTLTTNTIRLDETGWQGW